MEVEGWDEVSAVHGASRRCASALASRAVWTVLMQSSSSGEVYFLILRSNILSSYSLRSRSTPKLAATLHFTEELLDLGLRLLVQLLVLVGLLLGVAQLLELGLQLLVLGHEVGRQALRESRAPRLDVSEGLRWSAMDGMGRKRKALTPCCSFLSLGLGRSVTVPRHGEGVEGVGWRSQGVAHRRNNEVGRPNVEGRLT